MFKELTNLQVVLLERALNTEINTIARMPAGAIRDQQLAAVQKMYKHAEMEDARRVAARKRVVK